MDALLYFLLWAGLFLLMMRFGCGRHVLGHGGAHGNGSAGRIGSRGLKWMAPERDIDPVCGKSVETHAAKPSIFDGRVYYFCSRECREAFEAAPAEYVTSNMAEPSHKMAEDSHG